MNKKIIFSVLGVVVFLCAGVLTMIFKPAEKFEEPQVQPQPQIQNEIKQEIKIQDDWYVYVTGEVRNPGVYKISPDSRIFQAVEKAGGFTAKADRNSINMAEKITGDGLQIVIAPKYEQRAEQFQNNNIVKAPGMSQTQRVTNRNNTGSVMVDINTATAQELTQIKGIGPAIAKRIIEYRNTNGRFQRPEDLIKVRGIGEKTLEKMRPQIVIR